MDNLKLYKQQCIKNIVNGIKLSNNTKIGIEIEGFLYNKVNNAPLYYNNTNYNIQNILTDLQKSTNYSSVLENNNLLGLTDNTISNIGNISLEPGGQIEYSGVPLANIKDIENNFNIYLNYLQNVLSINNIGLLYLGYNPLINAPEHPIIPKLRYNFMVNYMPKVGTLGTYMMKGTATCQVNLDYISETDLADKMQVTMKLSSLFSAIYANSPIVNKKISIYNSYRLNIWQHTDANRSGLLSFVFNNFSIEKYIDYAINLPMYFVIRNNNYIDVNNVIAKDFLSGKVKIKNLEPCYEDLELHLTTFFPDVRLKSYLEIRTLDACNPNYVLSIAALYKGLLYNQSALLSAKEILKDIDFNSLYDFKKYVPLSGISTKINNIPVIDILHKLTNLSYQSLIYNKQNEEIYLLPLLTLIDKKTNLANNIIAKFTKSANLNNFLQQTNLFNN